MNEHDFRNIYRELIEENPLAVRAVLKILAVEFTTSVPTLAVTCDTAPRLLVNLDFVNQHCESDAEVKGIVCHEFLHVLLRHTDRMEPASPAEHIALDAVINAIIDRTLGEDASAFMSRYYANERGARLLLRPPAPGEIENPGRRLPWKKTPRHVLEAWAGLYDGRLVADDVRDLAEDLAVKTTTDSTLLIGNHGDLPGEGGETEARADRPTSSAAEAEEALRAAVDTALKSMNGSGVFRSPHGCGLAAGAYAEIFRAANAGVERWRRDTYEVLRRHLMPDPNSAAREPAPSGFVLPVLSPGDRRATLRALWSPFLPNAQWTTEIPHRGGSAQVYLDVSGSMFAEMPIIVTLLGRLSRYIRRPFWAFSTEVAPARIEGGRLLAGTTGGTSMTCVLEHLARTRPPAAVVVTDGYIEAIEQSAVKALSTRVHVLVTRDGSPNLIAKAGLPFTQLARLPQ